MSAGALMTALREFGLGGEVKGQGAAVTAAGALLLRVVCAQSAQGGWLWSWRHDSREHGHPPADSDGTAEQIPVCVATASAGPQPSQSKPR